MFRIILNQFENIEIRDDTDQFLKGKNDVALTYPREFKMLKRRV